MCCSPVPLSSSNFLSPSTHFVFSPSAPSPPSLAPGCPSTPLHFWGLLLSSPPLGLKEVLPAPAGRKYSTGSSLLTSSPFNDPDSPTLLHRSSGSRPYPDIFFAPPSLSLSCSWEVLQDQGSDHLTILLSVPLSPVFRANELPPSIFRKLAEMTLSPTLIRTILQQRNNRPFPLLLLSLPLWH